MNKLAAGALALALGLGAVAPAVAAETKDYSGAELFMERYEKELKNVNALRKSAIAAQEKIDAAKKRLNDAKAKVNAAEKAYKAQFPYAIYKANAKPGEDPVYSPQELSRLTLDKEYIALNLAYGWKGSIEAGDEENITKHVGIYASVYKTPKKTAKDARDAVENEIKAHYNEGKGPVASELEKQNKISAYVVAVEQYYLNSLETSPAQQLYNELVAALAERTAAQTNYDTVYENNKGAVKDYDDALTDLTEDARGYGYVVQIGNNGIKLVKDGEDKIKAPGKKATRAELIKELKAEVERNRAAVASAEFLLKYTPKTVAKVEGKLKAQIVDAKAAIEKAEKALAKVEKKAAFIATAYADDEEVSDEDLESLIKDNKESADNLENTMKENEKAQPEVEEKEEEKKPEEKKEEEKTPSKKAGNNARTGIAGVAGVAGILAAASVAYAASKRD